MRHVFRRVKIQNAECSINITNANVVSIHKFTIWMLIVFVFQRILIVCHLMFKQDNVHNVSLEMNLWMENAVENIPKTTVNIVEYNQ